MATISQEQSNATDGLRVGANVAFAASQIVVSMMTGGGPQPGGDNFWAALADPTPIQPAPYAFAIWGIIFLGALYYAWYQAVPSRWADPLLRRIGWITALGFAASTAWMLVAEYGAVWLTLPIIALMLVAFMATFRTAANSMRSDPRAHWSVVVPLGLYSGWLLVALFANLLVVLTQETDMPFGISAQSWTVASLALAAVIGLFVVLRTPESLGFVTALIWGLVGVAVANLAGGRTGIVLLAAGASLLIFGAYWRSRQRTVHTLVPAR